MEGNSACTYKLLGESGLRVTSCGTVQANEIDIHGFCPHCGRLSTYIGLLSDDGLACVNIINQNQNRNIDDVMKQIDYGIWVPRKQ